MILSQISYLDCIVFLIFLAPQLLQQVNTFELLACFVRALPFFCKIMACINVLVVFSADEKCSISATPWVHF